MNEEPIELNRTQRRAIQKKHHFKAEPMPLVDKGPCAFCREPVLVAQGQLYTLLGAKPVHKVCRLSTG